MWWNTRLSGHGRTTALIGLWFTRSVVWNTMLRFFRQFYVAHSKPSSSFIPSVLWRCCLGDRKGIQPVKNWVVGCWRGYLSGARCRLAYGPADATATHCLLLSKIQIGFIFLVLAHLGSPGKRAIKWVCVFVCQSKKKTSWGWSVWDAADVYRLPGIQRTDCRL